jgi:UDP:flavonoid glycosyltransferase YjiC (YdhE family)
VGDFRLSLAVSAELAGIPYITISNACWSPYTRQYYTVPELPLTALFGPRVGQCLFSLGRPVGFALHCIPVHRLRRHYGLRSLGFDLRRVYTHADYTLYADIPGLYDTKNLPANHRFIGPVIWSPAIPLPDWWQELPSDRPFVYVTLGGSGQTQLLPSVLEALGQLEVTALVSTAGAEMRGKVPANVFWDSYLPGEEAVKLSSLVICNGGSPTTHQALSQGVPVLGLAGNLDQYLNMATIDSAGAGRLLRSGVCSTADLLTAIRQLLADKAALEVARSLSARILGCDSGSGFTEILEAISSGKGGA